MRTEGCKSIIHLGLFGFYYLCGKKKNPIVGKNKFTPSDFSQSREQSFIHSNWIRIQIYFHSRLTAEQALNTGLFTFEPKCQYNRRQDYILISTESSSFFLSFFLLFFYFILCCNFLSLLLNLSCTEMPRPRYIKRQI